MARHASKCHRTVDVAFVGAQPGLDLEQQGFIRAIRASNVDLSDGGQLFFKDESLLAEVPDAALLPDCSLLVIPDSYP